MSTPWLLVLIIVTVIHQDAVHGGDPSSTELDFLENQSAGRLERSLQGLDEDDNCYIDENGMEDASCGKSRAPRGIISDAISGFARGRLRAGYLRARLAAEKRRREVQEKILARKSAAAIAAINNAVKAAPYLRRGAFAGPPGSPLLSQRRLPQVVHCDCGWNPMKTPAMPKYSGFLRDGNMLDKKRPLRKAVGYGPEDGDVLGNWKLRQKLALLGVKPTISDINDIKRSGLGLGRGALEPRIQLPFQRAQL
ncbi:uncharacterized protein LOC124156197 [Ischnura elegans]|uniref:uncharacterized protein LOC124156197 n=1 Tax=Ischnura elegans TaxID=197161 RepID=UPI001ED88AA9|nr:uncharacterized protein LOC124156197 [Ischnura elegans]